MKKYWIKLWIDLLEDEKLLPLDEVYQLRFMKLCLLSAKLELSGMLPPVETIAFWLRLTPKQVDLTLSVLSKCGVVSEKPGEGWLVRNFAKRQAPLSGTDRSRLSRSRDDATNMQRKGNETLQDSVPLSSVPLSSDSSIPSKNVSVFKLLDDSEALNIFTEATTYFAFPAETMEQDITRINATYRRTGSKEATVEAIKAARDAWMSRKRKDKLPYSPLNTTYLDWAVAGEIPEKYRDNSKQPAEPASFQALREYAERLNDGG